MIWTDMQANEGCFVSYVIQEYKALQWDTLHSY